MAPSGRKGEKEATGSSVGRGRLAELRPGSQTGRGSDQCGKGWPRMVAPRGLGLLLLLLLLLPASGEKTSTRATEAPRNVCGGPGVVHDFQKVDLHSAATCFTKCQLGSNACDLEKLHRYWLNYESFLVENSSEKTVNMSFVKTLVQDFSTDISEELHFSLIPDEVPKQIKKEDKPSDRVRLPGSLLKSLRDKGSVDRLAITVLDIGPGNIFKGPQGSLEGGGRVLNNRLVGLSVGRTQITGLSEPLEITFSHRRQPRNMTLHCVFWDVTKGPTGGDWASEGCLTELRGEETVCRCNHLTFFALLLSPVLDEATVQALKRISQAGCGTSMVFLAFTVVLYLVLRFYRQRFKSDDAPKIHVSLSVSLFLLNLLFFVNVESHGQASEAACWVRGAVFHYFLLCTFTWMGLEAFHLYLLVIRVFNTYFRHYFLRTSLLGWGLPALMVISTGSANSYGRYTIRNAKDQITLELCWIRNKAALYITVHGYFLLTFLFSAVVLGLVAWKIFTLPSATAGKEHRQHWKGVLTVLGLSSLLGVTWGLACLTPLGLSTVYIFAILNSLQGVFIFCWFSVLYFPSQRAVPSSSGTARADQSHTMSHD
ncbi:adhesion G protein-coupled receptor G3 [Dasypus novemcinctus]|uniref:adhesion G protein-coupled receptor G3 n=1 Tax=Dasypus novemcinctus TaxID=9361 RepID=UPI00265EFF3A|nr:adhesion G protein-coupled receptor G3 [Dasypus novemcinctus]